MLASFLQELRIGVSAAHPKDARTQDLPPTLTGCDADDCQGYPKRGAQSGRARPPVRQGDEKRAEAQDEHQCIEGSAQANVGHQSETGQQHAGDGPYRVPG